MGKQTADTDPPITRRLPPRGRYAEPDELAMSGLDRGRAAAQGRGIGSPITTLTGLRITDAGMGMLTCAMPVCPWWQSAAGVMPAGPFAPLDLKINYLRPAMPSEGRLVAKARVVHKGRSMAVVHVEVLNPEGKQVAMATESVLILRGRPWDRPVHVADEVAVDPERGVA